MAILAEVGLVQAVTEAISEADAEIGGFRMTRTTAVIAHGTDLVGAYQWPGGAADRQPAPEDNRKGSPRAAATRSGREYTEAGVRLQARAVDVRR